MANYIKFEKPRHTAASGQAVVSKHELLKGEIDGVATEHVLVQQGARYTLAPCAEEISVCLFLGGNGVIEHGKRKIDFHPLSVFVPEADRSFSVAAYGLYVTFLEITLQLSKADRTCLETSANKHLYFAHYQECQPYQEEIKSPKTVSRMLIPGDIVPRMSMGSVQTSGPDVVASHSHPMLEQLFYGLQGNSCSVMADGHEAPFEEDTLLHIPLGSNHGVRVGRERFLHYIWMDFFRTQQDMSYLSDSHFLITQ